jgi:hypothetical protein
MGTATSRRKQSVKQYQSMLAVLQLFVTVYFAALGRFRPNIRAAQRGTQSMKGIKGIIVRIGTVVFGTAAYALIGMAIAAAG